jgi:2-(1,2-epoxy-1,2-dihydrophenyl)acetyl-CoA isomerase
MSVVGYRLVDGAAHLALSAPDRGNPLDQAMADELFAAVRRARADDARVVVLRSEGKAFSVGGDVGAFAAAEPREDMVDDLAETLHRTVSELHRMDAVVVAVVQGVAAGAGLALAAAADVVLAGASARFTLAYTKIGFSPDGGSSLLTASLGLHRALHLALLNPVLSAAEAQAAGLVAEMHPDDGLDAAADRVVALLLAGSRTAQVAAKRLLRDVALPGAEAALRRETLSVRTCAAGPDGREGVRAFLAKRAPDFPSTRD